MYLKFGLTECLVFFVLSENPTTKPDVFTVRPLVKDICRPVLQSMFPNLSSDFVGRGGGGKVLVYIRSGKAMSRDSFFKTYDFSESL